MTAPDVPVVLDGPGPTRSSMIRSRVGGPAYGVAGQLLNAATNVVTTYAASLLLTPDDFGRFALAFTAVTVVLAAGRGLIGSTMVVQLPATSDSARGPLACSAFGFTGVVAVAAVTVVAGLGFLAPVLWWFAPGLLAALLQDAGRHELLSVASQGRALALDVAWGSTQVVVLVSWYVIGGAISMEALAVSWGLGAVAGVVTHHLLRGMSFAHPRQWARATRDVAGWFTAGAVLGQAEVLLVLLLAGTLLDAADVGGVRAVQLLAYQPALVILGALMILLQPAVVRARSSSRGLLRVQRQCAIALVPVLLCLAVVAAARQPLIGMLLPQYVSYLPLVVPIAVQSAFVALSIPPLLILRGLRRGRSAFTFEAARTAAMVAGSAVGAALSGVAGLAWGLAVVTAVAWLQVSVVARRAITRESAL